MGVHAMVKALFCKMKKNNTTNPRAFREWSRRAEAIATDLDKSGDNARKDEFRTIITTVADQFTDACGGQRDNVSGRMDPVLYSKRQDLLLMADEKLNKFQAPPEGRIEKMRKATIEDAKSLGFELDGLTTASDGLLRDISEPIRSAAAATPAKLWNKSSSPEASAWNEPHAKRGLKLAVVDQRGGAWVVDKTPRSPSPETEDRTPKRQHLNDYSLRHQHSESSGSKTAYHSSLPVTKDSQYSDSGLSQAWSLQSGRAHAQFEQKMIAVEQGDREPSIVIPISEMCMENGTAAPQLISIDHTFGELADTVLNGDDGAPLPDFWSKRVDHKHNCITQSGVWWEWQDPSTRVIDVIQKKKNGKKESLGIESVAQEGEYIVALVQKDEKEGGMPIALPRKHRQAASKHLQDVVFVDDIVSKVLELQTGDDASEKLFDRRVFIPMTNPVFIKVQSARKPEALSNGGEPQTNALGMSMEGVTTNPTAFVCDAGSAEGKGKGKERAGTIEMVTTFSSSVNAQ